MNMYLFSVYAQISDCAAVSFSLICAIYLLDLFYKKASLRFKFICFHAALTLFMFCYLQIRWMYLGQEQDSLQEILWSINECMFIIDVMYLIKIAKHN
jgi:hypothetical protein